MSETQELLDSADYSGEFDGLDSSPEWPEAVESSEAGWGEARRGGRRPAPPVRTAPRQSAYQPRPAGTNNPVTQAQLQAALARVSSQINTNSNAVKTLEGRVRGVSAEQARTTAMVRKELTDRRKDNDGLRRDLQNTRELSAVLPLITQGGGKLASLASLLFLVPPDSYSGGGANTNSGTANSTGGGGLLGGNNFLLTGLALAFAGGLFDDSKKT